MNLSKSGGDMTIAEADSASFFKKCFGAAAQVHSSAPGRVNLIGEHTDYNGGFVLPATIPQKTHISLARRNDNRVRLASDGAGMDGIMEYEIGKEVTSHDWDAYLRGATWVLGRHGQRVGGFEAAVTSSVPVGAGLSSSAALLVAHFRALREAFTLQIDDVGIAKMSREVENEFVGARVGIMDQMSVSLAREDAALFLDTRDLTYRLVRIPLAKMELFVIDSGVKHSHAHGGYNIRRAECEAACRALGVGLLREVRDLSRLNALPELLRKRARHVITEDARVLAAVEALESGRVAELGQLFVASHESLRDDYEVSAPEVDILVDTALTEPGVFGARMTGGGFGGSIVGICEPGRAADIATNILERYVKKTSREGRVVVPSPRDCCANTPFQRLDPELDSHSPQS